MKPVSVRRERPAHSRVTRPGQLVARLTMLWSLRWLQLEIQT